MLVSLNIDAILKETTIHRRRQKLNVMTDGLGLGDAYGATLGRIKGQGGEKVGLGMATLMWISHAERPLKLDELCHALAVEVGSPNVNTDNVPSIGTLLACCQGLVVMDKEASTVRLIHFTLQEYLRAHVELFGIAHATMTEICLSYLNSQQVKALSITSPDPYDAPFLEYSSAYWGAHAKRDLSNCAKLLAVKLFDDRNNQIPTKILLGAQVYYSHITIDSIKLSWFSGLHYASLFGIVEIVVGLLEIEGCDISQEDCMGNTPLMWAARNGHESVMEILLGRDEINPNKQDFYGQTPLYFSAQNGHEGVLTMLLGRDDINPNEPDMDSQTPLCCAAQDGREGAVQMLLGRDDINPDQPDKFGQTPLCCAAWYGHEGVVKMLLERDDINPDEQDNLGQTPLLWAADSGNQRVVKMLLGRDDINPDQPDKFGQTPLFCAARNGYEGVVKILLGRDEVNPGIPDNGVQTPPRQCSQSSGAPVGPGGGTAKTPGRDGTAKCSPSSSLNPQDGRHWQGRQAPRSETTWDRGRQRTTGDGRGRSGTAGDSRGRQGTVGDGRGRRATAGDGRGVLVLPERVGDGRGLWGTAGDGG